MYLLAILGVIVSVVLMGVISEMGVESLSSCIDLYSLLLILIIVIPMMASMGMLKDLNRAFKFTLGKKQAGSLPDLKRAKLAVTYLIRCSLFAGAVSTLFGGIQVLAYFRDEPGQLGAGMGVALCSLLYAFVIAIVLLPIEARLEQKIIEFMESEG